MKEIYIKAEDKIIDDIVERIRDMIGNEVRIVDLKPEYKNEIDN